MAKFCDQYVIVSRHQGAIDFAKQYLSRFATKAEVESVPVVAQATSNDVYQKTAIGNLPMHLACWTHEVWAIEFEGDAPRGMEYTLDDMKNAGAVIRAYKVTYCGEKD